MTRILLFMPFFFSFAFPDDCRQMYLAHHIQENDGTVFDIEEYIFGENIEDPYRWLEDFTSKETLAWVEEQNNLTDSFITNDYQKKIKKDLEEIWITADISIPFKRGTKI